MWILRIIHMEIIQERIEREFNLDIITTAPSVIYKVTKDNGEIIEITNPTNLPEPTEIDYMEEPIVKASIITPTEYVGAIMEFMPRKKRSIYRYGIY